MINSLTAGVGPRQLSADGEEERRGKERKGKWMGKNCFEE